MFDNIIDFDCFHVIRNGFCFWRTLSTFLKIKIKTKKVDVLCCVCSPAIGDHVTDGWPTTDIRKRDVSAWTGRERQRHTTASAACRYKSLFRGTTVNSSDRLGGVVIGLWSSGDRQPWLHRAPVWWLFLAGERDAWWGGTEEENRPVVALNKHPQLLRYINASQFHRRKATYWYICNVLV